MVRCDFCCREAAVVEADAEGSEDVPMAGRKGVWGRFEILDVSALTYSQC